MSYGQNGQRWSSPSHPTSQAADPYGPDSYSYPSVPPHPPASFAARATPGASATSHRAASRHPGWLARSLFWAALIIGVLPGLVLAPLSMSGGSNTAVLYSLGTVVSSLLRLVIGTIAMLLVKNVSWTRRFIAAGVYLFGCICLLVLTPVVNFIFSVAGTGAGTDSTLRASVAQVVLSVVYLAALFCAWNIVRRRRWWILVVGVIIAVVMNAGSFAAGLGLNASSLDKALSMVIVQGAWLMLLFIVLGLFHLLGLLPAGTVPMPSRLASTQQRVYPQQIFPQAGHMAQAHPNQWPPGSGQQSFPHHWDRTIDTTIPRN